MALKSALEDLLGTTLAGVAGTLGKIEYLAGLRDTASGTYSHWGFARVYGEAAAEQALVEAHRLLFLKLLRTPLRELRADVMVSSRALAMTAREYLERLRRHGLGLQPQDLGGGCARHFSSVLHALSLLFSTPAGTPQDAIPPA